MVEQFHEEFNAGDVEGAQTMFADDVVVSLYARRYVGKGQMRPVLPGYMEACTLTMTKVTMEDSSVIYDGLDCDDLGKNRIRVTVEGGLIAQLESLSMTLED